MTTTCSKKRARQEANTRKAGNTKRYQYKKRQCSKTTNTTNFLTSFKLFISIYIRCYGLFREKEQFITHPKIVAYHEPC